MKYTVKRVTYKNFTQEEAEFISLAGHKLQKKFNSSYYWFDFPMKDFIKNDYLIVCYRDERPVGFLMATLCASFFDQDCVTLRQNLLYALPGTRAALLLLKEFVDFGKVNANHVITAIGPYTNIKPSSLKRLGFNKLEELYRMETRCE